MATCRLAPAWAEFGTWEYGSSHGSRVPFDLRLTLARVGLNSLRNKGNTTFVLTATPDPVLAYLSSKGTVSLPVIINNYAWTSVITD